MLKYLETEITLLLRIPSLQFKPYGSFITELMTPYSDIDITLLGLDHLDKLQHIQILSTISDYLGKSAHVETCLLISTASIPILKLSIDIASFFCPRLTQKQVQKVDLVVQQYNEDNQICSSIRTTLFIREVILKHQSFAASVTFLKFVFAAKNWNDSYKGGICGFGISLLFLAFLAANKKQDSSFSFTLLVEFFQFLESFDCLSQKINLGYQLSCFSTPIQVKEPADCVGLVVYDPTSLVMYNVTRTSSKFLLIQQEIRHLLLKRHQKK